MVDIIIPAYNCADTLPRTLASLVAQTSQRFVVTVVDDCSTQNIKKIVNDFKVYLNIQYIRNETNLKFPGLVRQVGLDNTKCPYVMFLDSDDMFSPMAIEIAEKEMDKTDADLLLSAFLRQNADGSWNMLGENDTTWLHGNIYRRSFLQKNNIRFPSGYNEDGGFNTQCYMLMTKSGFIREPMYYWMDNKKSLTRTVQDFGIRFGCDVISTLTEAYKNILCHGGSNTRTWNNMGNHFGFFHHLYNSLLSSENDMSKPIENFEEEAKKFIMEVGLNSNVEYIKEFKKGFCNGFVKYPKEKIVITPNEFLEKIGTDIKITTEDFNRLGEKQQLTKEEIARLEA